MEVLYFIHLEQWLILNLKEKELALIYNIKVFEFEPKSENDYLARGNVLAAKKEYDKAILEYSKAITINNKYGRAYRCRGILWLYEKEYDKALEDFNQAANG